MNLSQKKKAQAREDLRRRALNAGTASRNQQIDSADYIRKLEAEVAKLEGLVYAEVVD